MFFPQTYSAFGADIADDAVVIVGAKVRIQDDRVTIIANDLVVPDFSAAQVDRPLAVSLPTRQCTIDKVTALKQVLSRHPGTSQVHLRLISGDRITTLELDQSLRVTPSSALMGDLKALLGRAASAARKVHRIWGGQNRHSRHIAVWIDRPAGDVYAYASDVTHLPDWAAAWRWGNSHRSAIRGWLRRRWADRGAVRSAQ